MPKVVRCSSPTVGVVQIGALLLLCCCVSIPAPAATVVGENHMSQVLEWRERLESAHKQLQDAMTDLITNKNYSEAERRFYAVDQLA